MRLWLTVPPVIATGSKPSNSHRPPVAGAQAKNCSRLIRGLRSATFMHDQPRTPGHPEFPASAQTDPQRQHPPLARRDQHQAGLVHEFAIEAGGTGGAVPGLDAQEVAAASPRRSCATKGRAGRSRPRRARSPRRRGRCSAPTGWPAGPGSARRPRTATGPAPACAPAPARPAAPGPAARRPAGAPAPVPVRRIPAHAPPCPSPRPAARRRPGCAPTEAGSTSRPVLTTVKLCSSASSSSVKATSKRNAKG